MAVSSWRTVFPQSGNDAAALYQRITAATDPAIYQRSAQIVGNEVFFMVQEGLERKLVVVGEQSSDKFTGVAEQINDYQVKVCPLTTANRQALQTIFDWLNPKAVGTQRASIGLGDRLGLATPGHIAAVANRDVMPILAQQSIRELDLTGRSYPEVLDAAAWAVFQEGYTLGYGADGDHLKNPSDVQYAIDLGFSMITLDCSEHINDQVSSYSQAEVDSEYEKLDPQLRKHFETTYLNQQFTLKSGSTVKFESDGFKKMVLVYVHALDFAEDVYKKLVQPAGRGIDFEMSIDEVATPTTPQDHFFVANELIARGVQFSSIAPRFVGEFQKGIDYIGDPNQFEAEFKIHAEIADHFGYKISVHSGSDKFMVFGIVGQYTKGRFHVKTAGTNWLEAVRVIAEVNPQLYREMHQYALANLEKAKQYYHVTLDPAEIPDIDTLSDQELPNLMNQDAARQAIHITYGVLLQAVDSEGRYLFKDRFYRELMANQGMYAERLKAHIGRHLDCLNINA